MKNIGTFYVGCKVENHKDPKKVAVVPKLLVDTGSEFTWLPAEVLERIGVETQKKDIRIQMANGEILTRTVGFAVLRVNKFFTIDEVVFAQKGDLALLGSRALAGMNVQLDRQRRRLVPGGPVLAAAGGRRSLFFGPPSPRPSPPGEGESSPTFGRFGRTQFASAFEQEERKTGIATRARIFHRNENLFSLSSGERAGVRASVSTKSVSNVPHGIGLQLSPTR